MSVLFLSFFNKNNAKQDLLKHPICLTDSDHDYILKEIEQRDKIELGINSMDNGDWYILVLKPIFILLIELLYIYIPQDVYWYDEINAENEWHYGIITNFTWIYILRNIYI